MKKLLLCLALLALFVPCAIAHASAPDAIFAAVSTGMFSQRDFVCAYDEASSVVIELLGDTAACASDTVHISDGAVTLTGEGPYILRGSLDDGMIIVLTNKKVKTQLVLDGASIHSETSAPIYVLQSDKTFITAAPGSVNTLSNGGAFVPIDENAIDAAIFSKEDLTINGSGSISIVSPAGHGVVSKDSLTIAGGTIDIQSASHGVSGKDGIAMAEAALSIVSGKDGVHAENKDDESLGSVYIHSGTLTVTAGGDGVSAASDLSIAGGSFTIATGGGSETAASLRPHPSGGFRGGGMRGGRDGRMRQRPGEDQSPPVPDRDAASSETETESTSTKGLKAGSSLTISGGFFSLDTADDSVHAGSVTVNDGSFSISAGDDAVHADGNLSITGGSIQISASYEGLEGQHVLVSGGDISLYASDDGVNAAGGETAGGEDMPAPYGKEMFPADGARRSDRRSGGRGGQGRGGAFGRSMSSGSVVISGGSLYINSHADGIDANGSLTISGGYTVICGPTQGDTSTLDYDTTAVISGGTLIGTGAQFMAQTFSDAAQGMVSVRVGSQAAGTEVTLTDSDGTELLRCTPELPYAMVIFSSPQLVSGETYTLTAGSFVGEAAAD